MRYLKLYENYQNFDIENFVSKTKPEQLISVTRFVTEYIIDKFFSNNPEFLPEKDVNSNLGYGAVTMEHWRSDRFLFYYNFDVKDFIYTATGNYPEERSKKSLECYKLIVSKLESDVSVSRSGPGRFDVLIDIYLDSELMKNFFVKTIEESPEVYFTLPKFTRYDDLREKYNWVPKSKEFDLF